MRIFTTMARNAVAVAVSTVSLMGAVSAQAAAPTSGIFTFDSGILALLSNATIASSGDATFAGATKTNIFTKAVTYTSAVVTMQLPTLSVSSPTAADLMAAAASQTGFTVTTSAGLVLSFSDIIYNNVTHAVSSTIAAGGTTLFAGEALSAASAVVTENFDVATGKGLLTTAPLYLTAGAASAFADAFGIPASLLPTVQSTKFGTLAVDVVAATAAPVTPSIPEPSTYALMGLGLVGIALASRKRAA